MIDILSFSDKFREHFAKHGIVFERYCDVVNNWVVFRQPTQKEFAPGVPAVEVFRGLVLPKEMRGQTWPLSRGRDIFVSEDWLREEPADGYIPDWATYYIQRGIIEPDTA